MTDWVDLDEQSTVWVQNEDVWAYADVGDSIAYEDEGDSIQANVAITGES